MSVPSRALRRVGSWLAIALLPATALGPLARSAFAQTGPTTGPSTTAPAGPTPAAIEEAKRFFEEGESLRNAGKYQAALEAYQKSRALVPRASNTLNVGVCLFNLGRYDEAYEFFEEALTKYPEGSLSKEARDSTKGSMATIETRVGRVDVSANVDGTLVIDGRTRGKVPLPAPLRVNPGKHVVRVLRDGFETFEATAEVKPGETITLDAKLNPLTSAGRLRIEGDDVLVGGTISVDGAAVGTIPWEGTLAPGTHVCMVAKGDVGDGPLLVNVIVGQTVKLAVQGKPLGPERRIVVDPATADLSIDGKAVGKGRFQGRLPIGAHVVEAREPGYHNGKSSLEVTPEDGADFAVTLKVDEAHPRWRVNKTSGHFGAELLGGYGKASSFGDDPNWCAGTKACPQTASPSGFRVGALGSYQLDGGLGFFVRAGWLRMSRRLERQYDSSFANGGVTVPTSYDLFDEQLISGPFAGAGIGYRLSLSSLFDLSGRVLIDAAFVGVSDVVTGTGTGGPRTLTVTAQGSGITSRGLMLMVVPELAAGLSFGPLRVSLGAAFPLSLIDGPAMGLQDTVVNDPKKDSNTYKQAIDNARGESFAPAARAFSRFVTIVPQASIGYSF
jgi:hypothetical protein